MVDTIKAPNEEHNRRNVMGLQVLGGDFNHTETAIKSGIAILPCKQPTMKHCSRCRATKRFNA